MNTNFDLKNCSWKKETTKILPKHDLYFGSPINSPTAGLPIGDGDTGSLLWFEKDGLHININKCDLWSDSTNLSEYYCSGKEEDLTCIKHGGELVFKFNSPIFDYFYQKEFETRLSLSDATVYINSKTPFSAFSASAFSSALFGVSALKVSMETVEAETAQISLSRWGSRTFWRWYSKQKFAPEIGLEGTFSYAEGNRLYITQDIGTVKFCLGLCLDSVSNTNSSVRVNSHESRILFDSADNLDFTLFYTVKTGSTLEEAKINCSKALDNAVNYGFDKLYLQHRSEWESFWNKSHISISDDYLENLYYIYLYIMNSESRGTYPPHFTSGLWGFEHDYIPWVYYFHYNMQHMYAPLGASGHNELAKNYYEMRMNGLKAAKLYAENVKHKKGAFVHDVTDRYGRGADYDSLNCTPGAQIVMQMWHQWIYTGDMDFLNNCILPYMRGITEFYLDMFEKCDDGKYHIYNTTMYEGHQPTDDTLTDIVMVKALFSVYKDYAPDCLKDKITDVLNNLPETLVQPLSEYDWDGNVFSFGIGKGRKPVGDKTVYAGGLRNGKPVRVMYGDSKMSVYGFPDIELSPLYPAGILGLKDKGTVEFDRMTNQISLHNMPGENGQGSMHWNMIPIYLARMGMAEDLLKAQRGTIDLYQSFCNGFNAEEGQSGCKVPLQSSEWNNVINVETNLYTKVPDEIYTHFDFETIPILAQSVNESLLQSHEGLIRICPAIMKENSISFSLFAENGFKVSAEISEDSYLITVESLRGETLFLKLPEYSDISKLHAYRKVANEIDFSNVDVNIFLKGREEVFCFDTLAGDIFLLSSENVEKFEYEPQKEELPNSEMKECGKSCLGSPTLLK